MLIKFRKVLPIILTVVIVEVVMLIIYFLFSNYIISFHTIEDAVCKAANIEDKNNIAIYQSDNVAIAFYDNESNTTRNEFLFQNSLGWHIGSPRTICHKTIRSTTVSCYKLKGKYLIVCSSVNQEDISDSIGSGFENHVFGPKIDNIYCYMSSLILDELPDDYVVYVNDESIIIR